MVSVAASIVSALVPFAVVLATVVLILYFTLYRKRCCCQPNQVKPEVSNGGVQLVSDRPHQKPDANGDLQGKVDANGDQHVNEDEQVDANGDKQRKADVNGDQQVIPGANSDQEGRTQPNSQLEADDLKQRQTKAKEGSLEKTIESQGEETSITIQRTQSVSIPIPNDEPEEDDAASLTSGTSSTSGSYTSSYSDTTDGSRVQLVQTTEREDLGRVKTPVEHFAPDPTSLPSTSHQENQKPENSQITSRTSSTSSYSYSSFSSETLSESGPTGTDSSPDSSWDSDTSSGSSSTGSFRRSPKNSKSSALSDRKSQNSEILNKHSGSNSDILKASSGEATSLKNVGFSQASLQKDFPSGQPLATSASVFVTQPDQRYPKIDNQVKENSIHNEDSISAILDLFEQNSDECLDDTGSVIIQYDEEQPNGPVKSSEVHLPQIKTSKGSIGCDSVRKQPSEEDMFQAGAYENIAKLSRIDPEAEEQTLEEVTVIPPLRLHQAVVPIQQTVPHEDTSEPAVATPTTPGLPKFRKLSLENKQTHLPSLPPVAPVSRPTNDSNIIPVKMRNICIPDVPSYDQATPSVRKDFQPRSESPNEIDKDIPSELERPADRLSGEPSQPKEEPLLNRPTVVPLRLVSSESGELPGIPNYNIEERAAVEQLRNKLRQRERLKIALQMMEEDKVKSRRNWENSLLLGSGTDVNSDVAPHPPKESRHHHHRHRRASSEKNGHRRSSKNDKKKCAQDDLVLKKLGRNMRARDRRLGTPLSTSERTAAERSQELLQLLNRSQKSTDDGKPVVVFTHQSPDRDEVKTVMSDSAQPKSMSTIHETKPLRKKYRKQMPVLRTPFENKTDGEPGDNPLISHRSELSIVSDSAVDKLITEGSLVNTKQKSSLPPTKEFLP